MKKINFSININAPKEKVWKVLWDDATYTIWVGAFCEGSVAITDWQEGSEVLFTVPGSGGGMFSTIAKKVPNEFMSFKHLGELKDGEKQPSNEKSKGWEGSHENYTLKDVGGSTILEVEMDIVEEHESFFVDTFPKALEKVKELSEE